MSMYKRRGDADFELGLSDGEVSALTEKMEKNRANTKSMTAERCAEARNRARDGETFVEIVDDMPVNSPGAVAYHARGNCMCEVGVVAVESDGANGGPRIEPEECDEIRETFAVRQDHTVRELLKLLGDELGMSNGGIYYHAYGRCECEGSVEPAPKRRDDDLPPGERYPSHDR